MSYEEFLKRKEIVDYPTGFEVSLGRLNPSLFDWQKVLVRWALLRGRAAIFASTGLGKTIMQLEWANHVHRKTRKPVLILAPLAVAEQTKQEGERFDIKSKVVSDQSQVHNGINITNYEKLHKFDLSVFSGVVSDECFPPDTPIDVFNIDKSLESRYIKDVRKGDSIYNAIGEDNVEGIHKRQIDRAIQIGITGQRITCSENHPFFTLHGWKSAQDLCPGDRIMATEAAVRLVRGDLSAEIYPPEDAKILREILLSELEDEYRGAQSESSYQRNPCQDRQESECVVAGRQSFGKETDAANCGTESDGSQGMCSENDRDKNQEWHSTAMERGSRRQWAPIANTTNDFTGIPNGELDTGISNLSRGEETGISDKLQGRFGGPNPQDSYRSRWPWACQDDQNGSEKRFHASFFRVESVEILEQGHPELEKYRDADGLIYFYDIEAARHPSFSVNGVLVHNSSILKSFSGTIRNQIINSFCKTPYRLSCTATPAPNDYTELGNQSEFLGVMTHSEMKATFFINDTKDTGTWRLKGHVKDNMFWKWIASWGAVVNMPSDLGFDDTDFILPPLTYHEHIIPANGKGRRKGFFLQEVSDLNDRRKVRRETISERCEAAVDLINSTNDRWLVWCNLNDEGLLLTKLIDDAVEVAGRHDNETKRDRLLGFANGEVKRLVSKPEVAGWGMNFQICHKAAFVGLNDSWESLFQATRRIWRFGQKKPVEIHIFIEEREGPVLRNIKRKDQQATEMALAMSFHMKDLVKREVFKATKEQDIYVPTEEMRLPVWMKAS